MALVTVAELLEAGVHFGHRTSRWNPKMGPFLHGKQSGIHIIDLRETVRGLIRATHFLRAVTAQGYEVLFVGTKRGGKNVVRAEALRCEMPFVTERWLGGTLTNFDTIRKRLSYLEELEEIESSGMIGTYSKKALARHNREKRKLLKNLEGIRTMGQLPGAVVVVDARREHIAVREANRMNIPLIALVDSDSDPDPVDIAIPANDDAMRSVSVIIKRLTDACEQGRRASKGRTGEPKQQRGKMDDRTADAIAAATGESGRRGPSKQVVVRRASTPAPTAEEGAATEPTAAPEAPAEPTAPVAPSEPAASEAPAEPAAPAPTDAASPAESAPEAPPETPSES